VAAAAATRHWWQQRSVGGGSSSGSSVAGSVAAAGEGRDVLAMYQKYFFNPFFCVPLQILYVEYYVFT
jgi:hypothetical protein